MTLPLSLTVPFRSTNRAHSTFEALAAQFHRALECACGAHADTFGARVGDALAEAAQLIDGLPGDVLAGCAERYTRHLITSDPSGRFAAAALIWRPGQLTPIHGHHTWCGYRVVKGTLTEEWFEWDNATTRARRAGTRERDAGSASFVGAGTGGIHRLANRTNDIAVSLHVYGVHAESIATRVNQLVSCDAPVEPV